MEPPPHSLHVERRRLCSQIDAPPHSLHRERWRPCGQALHTLHFDRYFTPCSHGPFVGGALFRFVPFFVNSPPPLSVSSTSPSSLRVTLTFGRQIVVGVVVIPPSRPSNCPLNVVNLFASSVIIFEVSSWCHHFVVSTPSVAGACRALHSSARGEGCRRFGDRT